MKQTLAALLLGTALLLTSSLAFAKETKIEIKSTTAEWAMLYNRGVETGKRLSANCHANDYVDAKILGETFKVCKKYKIFVNSPQYKKSPDAFQLGFLSTLR